MRRVEEVMGTVVSIDVWRADPVAAAFALDEAFEVLHDAEERFRALLTGDEPLDANGAVVRTWTAQHTADELIAQGMSDFCVNAGGDVVRHGAAATAAGLNAPPPMV
ncbi:MAG: hypothetical protein FWF28_00415 [Micrococcales bacterium]|nr:hypothetical protein [Micrococcales bacterium]